jgi:hypothetical protein
VNELYELPPSSSPLAGRGAQAGGDAGPAEVAPREAVLKAEPRCVALTQEHRGHGVSTAAYYLGRALVGQGYRVLLGDLSQHPSEAVREAARHPTKHLVPWTPPPVAARDLPRVIAGARRRTAGLADVILLDVDVHLLERAGGLEAGVSYVAVVVEHTPEGEADAERLVGRLVGTGPRSRAGVVFSRVDAPAAEGLPRRLESGLSVLGGLPADYLLAAGEAYSLKGGSPARPHDTYLNALERVARNLIDLVPLPRPGERRAGPTAH